jgi:hypothetical protein
MVYVIAYFSLIFFGQEMSYTVFELTYLSLSTYIITYKTVKAYVTNLWHVHKISKIGYKNTL